ncbi:MAG: M48 family metallopeptidase [Lachnospiraceae bacterium]|nr:M48 family metallopeptidase [Lachnospiraceae bacterium]
MRSEGDPSSYEDITYRLVRSRRRTIGIEITPEGEVILRAPLRAPLSLVEEVIRDRAGWIRSHQKRAVERSLRQEEALSKLEPVSLEDMKRMGTQMMISFPPRIKAFAEKLGVDYGMVTIRNQKTRWGSCSSRGNLNFNCLLMMAPAEVQDYVIVHELCHRLEMNHSKKFWKLVGSVIPDYRQQEKWLKEEGRLILLKAFKK